MTTTIKKLSCEMCGSNDLEFKIFVDEFGEPTSDVLEHIRTGHFGEAWCNNCKMWQGVK